MTHSAHGVRSGQVPVATMPGQMPIDWRLGHSLPFVTTSELAHVGRCSERQIHELIDCGKLTAVDCWGESAGKRLLRITRPSYLRVFASPEEWAAWLVLHKIAGEFTDANWEWLQPKMREYADIPFLQRWFRVSGNTVRAWFARREFASQVSLGAREQMAWRVPMSDVVEFCKRRVVS